MRRASASSSSSRRRSAASSASARLRRCSAATEASETSSSRSASVNCRTRSARREHDDPRTPSGVSSGAATTLRTPAIRMLAACAKRSSLRRVEHQRRQPARAHLAHQAAREEELVRREPRGPGHRVRELAVRTEQEHRRLLRPELTEDAVEDHVEQRVARRRLGERAVDVVEQVEALDVAPELLRRARCCGSRSSGRVPCRPRGRSSRERIGRRRGLGAPRRRRCRAGRRPGSPPRARSGRRPRACEATRGARR